MIAPMDSQRTTPVATVVITTRNRSEDLRRALWSAIRQTVSLEILVIDDGSSDSTSAMVKAEFPMVTLHGREQSLGYIVRRNEAAQLAQTETIFSIDDDAEFSSPSIVEQTLLEFTHKRIAAVAIPFVNVLQERTIRQQAPCCDGEYITDTYVGTAHAVQRSVFLALGGYREILVHQGEERDFCLRMLDAGYVVRLGRADPIHHYESPNRDTRRMDYYGWRNNLLFVYQNVPGRYFPTRFAAVSAKGLAYGIARARHSGKTMSGLLAAVRECALARLERRPVSISTYRVHRRLRDSRALPLDEIRNRLPQLRR